MMRVPTSNGGGGEVGREEEEGVLLEDRDGGPSS